MLEGWNVPEVETGAQRAMAGQQGLRGNKRPLGGGEGRVAPLEAADLGD